MNVNEWIRKHWRSVALIVGGGLYVIVFTPILIDQYHISQAKEEAHRQEHVYVRQLMETEQ